MCTSLLSIDCSLPEHNFFQMAVNRQESIKNTAMSLLTANSHELANRTILSTKTAVPVKIIFLWPTNKVALLTAKPSGFPIRDKTDRNISHSRELGTKLGRHEQLYGWLLYKNKNLICVSSMHRKLAISICMSFFYYI